MKKAAAAFIVIIALIGAAQAQDLAFPLARLHFNECAISTKNSNPSVAPETLMSIIMDQCQNEWENYVRNCAYTMYESYNISRAQCLSFMMPALVEFTRKR